MTTIDNSVTRFHAVANPDRVRVDADGSPVTTIATTSTSDHD